MDRPRHASLPAGAGLLVGVAIAAVALVPGQARGQCSIPTPDCDPGGGGDVGAPTIIIIPISDTVPSRPQSATVEFCALQEIDLSTVSVTVDGTEISDDLSTTSANCDWSGHALTGPVPLDPGSNTVEASGCDAASNCNTESTTYTFEDDSPPSVTFSPQGGTYTEESRPVTVGWCDDDVLEGSSRSITLNGSDVTGSFGYSSGSGGCGDSKESSSTVTLAAGDNILEAQICDASGNCTTESTTYTYDEPDTSPPDVTIDPADGTFTDSDLSATVQWCDTKSLDGSTRSITLNGTEVSGDFSYQNGSQSCSVAKVSSGTVSFSAGDNTLEAQICDDDGNCGSASASYHYDVPVSLDLTPHNGEYRDVAKCAVDCFEASVSYTTPAYTSMDAPRALTLLYRSGQVAPRGRVVADVSLPDGAPAPDAYSLRLQRPDGTWVDLLSGGHEVFSEGAGTDARLAAQFDAAGLGTGARDYTLVARAWYGSTLEEATAPVTVLVADRTDSPYGAGWSVAGLQRLHFLPGGDIAVYEGDGSVARFEQASSTEWSHPRGDWTELTKNGSGQYERRYPDGTVLTFDGSGRLVETRDRFGNATTYGYSSGKLTSVTDPAGKQITLGYGSDGKLAWIDGAGGRRTTVTIDPAGDLVQIEDPAGGVPLQATYDADHRMLARTDRGGGSWGFAYDDAGKIAADTMPEVETEAGLERPVTTFTSRWSQLLVDPDSGEGTSSNPAPAPPGGPVQAATTGPRGHTTTYEIDRWGSAAEVVTPLNGSVDVTATVTRDDSARVVETTSSSGSHMDYEWEGPDRVEVQNRTGPGVRTTTVSYEPTYHLPTEIAGDDVVTRRFWYDADGAVDSVRAGASGPATAFEHDGRGRVVERTDPEGHTTTFAYQSGGFQNRKRVVGAVGDTAAADTTRFAYDGYGRQVGVELPTGDSVHAAFDDLNRQTLAVNAHGDTVETDHGDLFPTQVTDPLGQTYTFTRNALGWTTKRTDPRGNSSTFVHDAAGNVVEATDRRGRVVTFDHNAAGQVVSRTAGGETTTIARNPNVTPSWVAASNAASTDTVWTDELGRRVKEKTVRGGQPFTVEYGYDAQGRRTQVEVTTGGSTELSTEFIHGQFSISKTLVDASGNSTKILLDDDGQLRKILYPTDDTLWVSNTATHRQSRLEWSRPALDSAFGMLFATDSLGRLEERIRRSSPVVDTTRRFSYDGRGWLTGYSDREYQFGLECDTDDLVEGITCTQTGSSTQVDSVAYAYDAVGNRTDAGATVETGNRLVAFGGYTLEWDAGGHLTHKQGNGVDQTFHWSAGGRLDSVVTNGATTRFAYDAFGRRVEKEGPSGTTQYVYQGDHVALELDGQQDVTAQYTWFPGVDRPHSVIRGGQTYYYARGVTNSVAGLFDGSGQPVNRYRYGPWGEAELAVEGVENALRYTGRRWDASTGLYHNRARYYDPDIARFVSPDPLGLGAGINPYAYAGNDPVNVTDPSGLMCSLRMATFLRKFGILCPVSVGGLTAAVSQPPPLTTIPGARETFDMLRSRSVAPTPSFGGDDVGRGNSGNISGLQADTVETETDDPEDLGFPSCGEALTSAGVDVGLDVTTLKTISSAVRVTGNVLVRAGIVVTGQFNQTAYSSEIQRVLGLNREGFEWDKMIPLWASAKSIHRAHMLCTWDKWMN